MFLPEYAPVRNETPSRSYENKKLIEWDGNNFADFVEDHTHGTNFHRGQFTKFLEPYYYYFRDIPRGSERPYLYSLWDLIRKTEGLTISSYDVSLTV